MKTIIDLIRLRQWYKNLVVFLPLIFSNLLLREDLFMDTLFAFVALCLISSANYVINDIVDKKSDSVHPEKKNRPIASGKISVTLGIVLAILLIIMSTVLAYFLSKMFLLVIAILFLLNQFYSFFLKKEPFVDILLVSINFVIRAVSGVFVINRDISPWLILCPFFLALFLVIGKRKSDMDFLGENSLKHKEVLKYYTSEITANLLTISTTLLIIAYSLYAFLTNHKLLMITIPIAIFVVFRYLYLIYSHSEIPRHPELMYKDKGVLFGSLLWLVLILLILYL